MRFLTAMTVCVLLVTGGCKLQSAGSGVASADDACASLVTQVATAQADLTRLQSQSDTNQQQCMGQAGKWDTTRSCCTSTLTLPPDIPSCALLDQKAKDATNESGTHECTSAGGKWDSTRTCCSQALSTIPPNIKACDDENQEKGCTSGGGKWDTKELCCSKPLTTLPPEVKACVTPDAEANLRLAGAAPEAFQVSRSVIPLAASEIPASVSGGGFALDDSSTPLYTAKAKLADLQTKLTDCRTSAGASSKAGSCTVSYQDQSDCADNHTQSTCDDWAKSKTPLGSWKGTIASGKTCKETSADPTKLSGACVVSLEGKPNECAENHTKATCDEWAKSKLPLGSWKGNVSSGETCKTVASASKANILGSCRVNRVSDNVTWCENMADDAGCRNWAKAAGSAFAYMNFNPGTTCIYSDGSSAADAVACYVQGKDAAKTMYCDHLMPDDCKTWTANLAKQGFVIPDPKPKTRCSTGSISPTSKTAW